jgi:hypothetical protein
MKSESALAELQNPNEGTYQDHNQNGELWSIVC